MPCSLCVKPGFGKIPSYVSGKVWSTSIPKAASIPFYPFNHPPVALGGKDIPSQSCRCHRRSSILHRHVLLERLGRVLHAMLVLHVAAPVVLARERLAAALFGVCAPGHGAVVLARLVVLVVDVPVQVRFGAEALVAERTLMGPLVVAFVVAGGVAVSMGCGGKEGGLRWRW